MKYGKSNFGVSVVHIYKIWQILKCFAGTFRRAQTLKLGEVLYQPLNLFLFFFPQKVVKTLRKESTTSEVQEYTTETLEYLKGRENLWKNQTDQIGSSKNNIIDFSSNDKLQTFYEKETLVVLKKT